MIQDIGSYTSIGESVLFGADYQRVYSVRIDLITPEKAKEMLEKNINRKLNMNRVNQYVDDMKSDRWKLNGVPIIITDDGYLKDGQHRLNALIKADVSIPFVVIRYSKNFEIEANNYDIGMTRSVNDLRTIQGKNRMSNTAVAAMTFLISCNQPSKRAAKTNCAEEIEKNYDLLSIIDEMPVKKLGKNLNNSGYYAAIVAAYKNGYSRDMLFEFDKVMSDGIMYKPEHKTIVVLRNHLLQLEKSNAFEKRLEIYLKTQNALKNFEKGNIVSRVCATKEFYKWEDNNNERN